MPSARSRVGVTVRLMIACTKSSSRIGVSQQTSPAKSAAAVGLPLSHLAVDRRPSAIAASGATLASRAAAASLQAPLANFLKCQCPGISDKTLVAALTFHSKFLKCLERRLLAVAPCQEMTAAPAALTAPGATAVALAAAVKVAGSWPISLACTPCDDEPV